MFSIRFLGGLVLVLAMIDNSLQMGEANTQGCGQRKYLNQDATIFACKDGTNKYTRKDGLEHCTDRKTAYCCINSLPMLDKNCTPLDKK
ncbi:hypothetical protein Pst134EA_027844 [Puccinia striiformis f. sp. tritici]|uniref:hypothetical protein n=1 Tax=Puccinia striiformis f. sp. tritici TaxID=168172 RepID=UPI002007F32B|nr:hypothetical protein Pst134EA_027844 [Puccinia striiformis f. sp. tritici]KAH9448533.1 hypothetical protein Pst134EA_027844 [Puccinia striiformis f. sp. tritici]KAI9608045.1 hypothetical protein H4Q26_005498 [Puccinia striiformis f. sp. tritici PST-130]